MAECKLVMTVEEMKDRSKWLEARRQGIGGSDAAAIVGMSPWKSKFALWAEKSGRVEETEKEPDNEYIYWGNKLEQLVADRFCEDTGKKVHKQGLLRNIKYPWMMASVDRVIVGENAGLECKTASSWKDEEWADDQIPANYIIQCLHYLLVTGYDRWFIAVLIGGNKFKYKCIERDEVQEDLDMLLQAEIDFWENNVVKGKMPEVDGTASCSEAIAKIANTKVSDVAEDLEGEFDTLCEDLQALKQEYKKLEKVIAEKENKLKARLGNSQFGRSVRYNIWYKPQVRNGYNTKQLVKDFPDIMKNYETSTTYRRLDVRISKARTQE